MLLSDHTIMADGNAQAFSCPFSDLFFRQCQWRLMVNLSDLKSQFLSGLLTARLYLSWLCSAFSCLPVVPWHTNVPTGHLQLSFTHYPNCSVFSSSCLITLPTFCLFPASDSVPQDGGKPNEWTCDFYFVLLRSYFLMSFTIKCYSQKQATPEFQIKQFNL